MKFATLFLAVVICAGFSGCARKPAYSNINLNASRGAGDAQAPPAEPGADAAASAGQAAGSSASTPDQPAAAQPQSPQSTRPTAIKKPEFLNMQSGEITDLPSYPKAQRTSIQYGGVPNEGDMASLVLATSDSMDNVAAFYERVIKSNGWKVSLRNRDPEFSEWTVKKGEKDEGRVAVKRDPTTRGLTIQIVRTAKPQVEKKQP